MNLFDWIMKIKKYLKYVFFFFLIWGLLHLAILLFVGLQSSTVKTDVILIFGNKVELSGEPSLRLQSRLDEGLRLYEEGVAPLIIVSGGIGKEGFDEAAVMKDYLIEKGVETENIIEDPEGNNSYLTGKNLVKISEEYNIKSVTLVSQYYHILRAKHVIKRFGFDEVYSSYGKMKPELRDLYSIPREILGYYVYLFKNYK